MPSTKPKTRRKRWRIRQKRVRHTGKIRSRW